MVGTKIFIRRPTMVYTQMNAYDIAKLIAELKSSDNVQYRNK